MKKTEIDMLNGPLLGKMIRFALPLALTSILQQLFNSADLAVVGRFESAKAMAAVGSNAALVSLIVSLFSGLAIGANVAVATYIGRQHAEKINDAIHTAMTVALISGVIILAVGEIFAIPILHLMNTPDDVLELASVYLRIFFFAMPFLEIYDFGAAVLRSKGDSARPLYVLIASGILNVLLNLLLVAVFHLGVAGVAIATAVSNCASAVMVIYFLMHEDETFRFHPGRLRIRKEALRMIIMIGAPAGLQGMVFSVSNVVIQTSVNSFGAAAIAGNTAAYNFEILPYFIINAIAMTATTFTSQNFAALKYDRCRRIYRLAMLLGLSGAALLSLVIFTGRHQFIQLFSTDPDVISFAMIRLQTVATLEFMTGTYEMPGGCLRGMGHSLLPATITIFGCCVFRLFWVTVIFRHFGTYQSLLWVYLASWIITGTCVTIAYFIISRKEEQSDVHLGR